ncbi:MAG: sensor domain-containing diguanylate cyclase [Candidatus Muiribacteriota bacterium]
MKKIIFILLNIIAIAGMFYAVSPDLLSRTVKSNISQAYNDVVPQNTEVLRDEIYDSADPELYSMDALLNNNEDLIDPGMSLLASNIGSVDNYISALKLKIIGSGRNKVHESTYQEYEKKLENFSSIIETRFILINVFSFIALLLIIIYSLKFGALGGVGSSLFYALLWALMAAYFRGFVVESGVKYLSEIFKIFSETGFVPGLDAFYNFNQSFVFTDILIKSGIFVLFGSYLGIAFSKEYHSNENKILKLETENKKKEASLNKLRKAEKEFKKAGDKIAKLSSRIISLQMLSQVLGASLNLEGALDEVMNSASKLFGAKKCAIFMLDKKKEKIYPKKYKGYPISDLNGIKVNLKDNSENLFKYVLTSKNLVTTDIAKKDFNVNELIKKMNIDVVMVAPLVHAEEVLGLIVIGDTENDKNIQEDGRLLLLLATLTGLTIKNAHLYQKTVEMANTDGLTGLNNNRYFNDFLKEAISRASTSGEKISLFMTDIDHFKDFNDTYGHQIGDFVLEQTAKVMKSLERDEDLTARYGGEEFVYVMPDTDTETAKELGEEMRKAVAGRKYKQKGEELSVTISVGVSTYPDHAKDVENLVKLADEGLYIAKEGGRNQVRCAAEEQGVTSSPDSANQENSPQKSKENPSLPEKKESSEEDDIFKF